MKIGSPRLDFQDWEQTLRLGRVREEVWTEERKPLVPAQEPLLRPIRDCLNAILPDWRTVPPNDPAAVRAFVGRNSAA